MGLSLTRQALSALKQSTKEPNIVLEIDGLGKVFGAQLIQQYVRIGGGFEEPGPGDPVPEIGDPETNDLAFYIGGFNLVEEQDDIITLDDTSTSIRQTLNIDKGEGSSISSLSVALMDDGYVTQLITPGELLDDILYRRCKVYLGFRNTAWPEDYVVVFRGFVTDVIPDAGKVVLQLSHPDEKKRSNIYKLVETALDGAIDDSQTTGITLASSANILTRIQGPDGTYDTAFKSYIRVEDELIEFTGITSNELTGVTRGALNTTAVAHDDGAQASTFYRLKGNGVHLALKLMASGYGGAFQEDVSIDGVNVSGDQRVENALFFKDIDVNAKYGLVVGDYVSLVNEFEPANDFTNKPITEIISTATGDFVVIGDVTLIDNNGKYSTASFRSQYDTLPDGLRMHSDEIDIQEHLRWYQLFLSNVEYDFYLKDTIEDCKEFIEKQVYSPMAAYSVPRKARASMGYHIGPIPGQDIKTFDDTNVKNPSKVKLRRSTSKQFYNEIVYKYDEDVLEEKFLSGFISISASSKNRIQGANKTLVIESKGLRTADLADTIAQIQGERRLKRYEFGAEILTFEALLQDAFGVEIGDIIVFDGTNLSLPDIKRGQKGMAPRFFEIQNKEFNIKTGDVRFEAVDTAFSGAARYCLISPSSRIKAGLSTTSFIIEESYAGRHGGSEYRKWERLKDCSVRVRSADFSTSGDTVIVSASSNTIEVSPALAFTPSAGMVLEFTGYSDADTTNQQRLIYGFIGPLSDGTDNYAML